MPFANYNDFDQSYFEENNVQSPHGGGYSEYRGGLLPFADFAQKIRDELEAAGQNINQTEVLVAGCAYGFTVQHLVDDHGIDAWGMDVSQFAVNSAPTAVSDRIVQGDVLSTTDLRNVRQTKGGGKFNVIVGEGLLVTMTDSEAVAAGDNMRSEAQDSVLWSVYDSAGFDLDPTWYNVKTMDEWVPLVDPDDVDSWFSRREFYP